MSNPGLTHESPAGRPPVETVNFHLWQPCNMHCGFCFATFRDVKREILPEGHLPRRDAVMVVRLLAAAGFEKITFAGGEPLLCPWLPELIETARAARLVTNVVTNGSLLTAGWLDAVRDCLDWVTLSVDSLDPATNVVVGRATAGRPIGEPEYRAIARLISDRAIRLKINTVVNRCNLAEDLSDFIAAVRPRRWKILQTLAVAGQNDGRGASMTVTAEQFESFVARHERVRRGGIVLVAEPNPAVIGSYAMVDPAGRFFDNVDDRYTYSEPILRVGVATALSQVRISRDLFLSRGGRYDFLA